MKTTSGRDLIAMQWVKLKETLKDHMVQYNHPFCHRQEYTGQNGFFFFFLMGSKSLYGYIIYMTKMVNYPYIKLEDYHSRERTFSCCIHTPNKLMNMDFVFK